MISFVLSLHSVPFSFPSSPFGGNRVTFGKLKINTTNALTDSRLNI